MKSDDLGLNSISQGEQAVKMVVELGSIVGVRSRTI